MYNSLLALLVCFSPLQLMAQELETPTKVEMGDVYLGALKSVTVPLKNTGSKPVTLHFKADCCSCLKVTESLTIPAGQTLSVTVTQDASSGLERPINAPLHIRDEADKDLKIINIQGSIKRAYDLGPLRILPQTSGWAYKFQVKALLPKLPLIKEITCADPRLHLSFDQRTQHLSVTAQEFIPEQLVLTILPIDTTCPTLKIPMYFQNIWEVSVPDPVPAGEHQLVLSFAPGFESKILSYKTSVGHLFVDRKGPSYCRYRFVIPTDKLPEHIDLEFTTDNPKIPLIKKTVKTRQP